MAYNQGFKSLKLKKRDGVIFQDVDWIAGGDYNDNNECDEEDDDKEYTITKKPKMTSMRKNLKNKKRLTLMRTAISSG